MAAARYRPKASWSLTLKVPVKPTIDEICDNILNGKRNIITLFGLKMTAAEVDELVGVFNRTEKTFEKLELISVFTSKIEDRTEDLKKLWDAVKTKVNYIVFKECTIPQSFRDHMNNQIHESKTITVSKYSLECCSDANFFSPSPPPPVKRGP